MKPGYRMGIDLGGTGIKLAVVNEEGRILRDSKLATPSHPRPRQIVDLICSEAKRLLIDSQRINIRGIGIGAAGDVDTERGIIRLSPNLGWQNVPLKALLSRVFKRPIFVENDANAAAWAAYVVENRRKIPNLITITLGTGVGGGIVIDGKLYRGASGTAGEIGHITLFPDGLACNCGNHGCLERYVGAIAIVESAKRALAKGTPTLISRLSGNELEKITPLMIHQAAQKKDPLALQLWQHMGNCLGIGLASLVNVLNPERIIFAGGLVKAGKFLLDPARKTLVERTFPTPRRKLRLVISKMDQHLGVVGAALIVP